MKWQGLIIDGYSRVLELLEPALADLTQSDLDEMPKPDCNSIGWTTWHLIRLQDAQIADLIGEEQVYLKDKWYAKFSRKPDAGDTGFGHTSEEVAAFKSPPRQILLDYYQATFAQTRHYITGLSLKDLDRQLNEPWYQPPPTVGVRIISIMADCLQHSGEAAYARGLLKGKGWMDA